MGEVAAAVSDEAFSALAENLGHILETRALLCVTAPKDVQGETVVEAALSRCDGAESVMSRLPRRATSQRSWTRSTPLCTSASGRDGRPTRSGLSRTNSHDVPGRWWSSAMPICCGPKPCSTSTRCGACSRTGNAGCPSSWWDPSRFAPCYAGRHSPAWRAASSSGTDSRPHAEGMRARTSRPSPSRATCAGSRPRCRGDGASFHSSTCSSRKPCCAPDAWTRSPSSPA